jgi:type VI secretion system Hcp family effector
MASQGYMTITGTEQGLISAGCSTQESIGNKYQSEHTDEIIVLSCDFSMINVGNNTRPTYHPIVINKYIDKSSPLLATALRSREEINCTIDFYRVSSFGGQEKFYTLTLKGGLIAELNGNLPHVLLQAEAELQEQLAIRYREISWVHHLAKTSGFGFWGE